MNIYFYSKFTYTVKFLKVTSITVMLIISWLMLNDLKTVGGLCYMEVTFGC